MRTRTAREIRKGIMFGRSCLKATKGSPTLRAFYFTMWAEAGASRTARRAAYRTITP